jgi:hypothetical protein
MKLLVILSIAALFTSKNSNIHTSDKENFNLANTPRIAKKNKRLFTKSKSLKTGVDLGVDPADPAGGVAKPGITPA